FAHSWAAPWIVLPPSLLQALVGSQKACAASVPTSMRRQRRDRRTELIHLSPDVDPLDGPWASPQRLLMQPIRRAQQALGIERGAGTIFTAHQPTALDLRRARQRGDEVAQGLSALSVGGARHHRGKTRLANFGTDGALTQFETGRATAKGEE